jgi:hypothetical protein
MCQRISCRPSDMKKYTLAFNGRLGRKVQDMELAALTSNKVGTFAIQNLEAGGYVFRWWWGVCVGERGSEIPESEGIMTQENLQGNNVAQEQPAAPKRVARVLMGHSLGAACATAEILKSQIKVCSSHLLHSKHLHFRNMSTDPSSVFHILDNLHQ